MQITGIPYLVVLLGVVGALLQPDHLQAQSLTLHHVHGLAYDADGKRLYIPIHHGLAIYEAGRWSKAPGPQHDYMGFTSTRERFYSSGHPAPGSGLRNPFGLILSTDGGRTWQKRGLEGESDFHVLAASYGTNAVYVYNPEPNSRMNRAGIYYTLNDGFSWTRAAADGLASAVHALAVHPSDAKIVAAAARDGLYFSRNGGARFERIATGQAFAAFFEHDGKRLLYSMHRGAAKLYRHALDTGQSTEVPLPGLHGDAVSYITQNPVNRNELAIATFERSIFLSRDGGATWHEIARKGQTQ